jgi:hypothetical protein
MGAVMAIAVTLSLRQNRSTGQHSSGREKRLPAKRHVEYPCEESTGEAAVASTFSTYSFCKDQKIPHVLPIEIGTRTGDSAAWKFAQ